MPVVRINISISQDLLDALNQAANDNYINRSRYIAEAITLKMQFERYLRESHEDKNSPYNLLMQSINRDRGLRGVRKSIKENPADWGE